MKQEEFRFSSAGRPVNHSQSRQLSPDEVLMMNAVNWPFTISEFLTPYSPNGLSGKMCLELLARTGEETSSTFYGNLRNAGIASLTEFWTLDTLESPRVAVDCLLSDILEE